MSDADSTRLEEAPWRSGAVKRSGAASVRASPASRVGVRGDEEEAARASSSVGARSTCCPATAATASDISSPAATTAGAACSATAASSSSPSVSSLDKIPWSSAEAS